MVGRFALLCADCFHSEYQIDLLRQGIVVIYHLPAFPISLAQDIENPCAGGDHGFLLDEITFKFPNSLLTPTSKTVLILPDSRKSADQIDSLVGIGLVFFLVPIGL